MEDLEKEFQERPNSDFCITFFKRNTSRQNNCYNSWIKIIAEYSGMTEREMKEAVKTELYLYEDFTQPGKMTIRKFKSFADMTPEEVRKVLDYIEKLGAEYSIVLPKTDLQWQILK